MKTTSLLSPLACVATLLLASPLAMAQKAGSWSASVGVTQISPAVSSGNLSAPSFANTKVDVNSNTQPTGAVNYAMSDNLVLSVPLGLGFKHKVSGAGAITGVGVLVETQALPITALMQYRFGAANAGFRPYAGAGLTYAKFYKTQGTSVLSSITNPGGVATTASFEDKLALSVQLGMVFNLNDKWYLDANYVKTMLSTTGKLSTGQSIDVKLNPNSYTFGVGYKF